MKKYYKAVLFSTLLGLAASMSAQNTNIIPNHDFENWTTQSVMFPTYETPVGWQGLSIDIDTMGIQFSYPLANAQKTTDAYTGNYAALVATNELDPMIAGALSSMGISDFLAIPTIMSIGGINIIPLLTDFGEILSGLGGEDFNVLSLLQNFATANLSDYFKGGAPLNGFSPASLIGHYKYTTQNNEDNAMILLVGSTYNSLLQRRLPAGIGMTTLSATDSYTEFEVPYYSLGMAADTIEVLFFSSQLQSISVGSSLYIDNLALTSTNSINTTASIATKCYPNPSSGKITLNTTQAVDVYIYNTVGQLVSAEKNCKNGAQFSLPHTGIYSVKMVNENGYSTQTIVIK